MPRLANLEHVVVQPLDHVGPVSPLPFQPFVFGDQVLLLRLYPRDVVLKLLDLVDLTLPAVSRGNLTKKNTVRV